MKIKSTLSIGAKALLCFLLINNLNSKVQAQNTVTVSRPTHTMYYEHDRTNWVHIHNTTSTYNSRGWLISTVDTDPVTNQNLTKTDYGLDQYDRLASSTPYTWQNNAWIISNPGLMNRIATYNAAGKITEDIWQYWQNGALSNHRKQNNVYDVAGNLIEEINTIWRNNNWENNDKSIYTYVNGVRTERLLNVYNRTTASWTPNRKYSYAGWHVAYSMPSIVIEQTVDPSGNWVNNAKRTITISTNGSYEEVSEYFQNNTWMYGNRANYTYDVQGNVTDFLFEEFVNNTWRMVWIDKQIFTYSPQNDMLEKIVQGQDSTYGPLRNQYKEVYSNFQYFTRALGTSENQKIELALNVYPNPASAKIQIDLVESKPQALAVTVSDITGKTMLTREFKAAEAKELNIEALPKGIYLLQLQTEAGLAVKRIVKQ